MRSSRALQEIDGEYLADELTRKGFACAHCGNTWVELVGLIVAHDNDGGEDLLLRVGAESKACQTCWLQCRECQKCGSKDIYEMYLPEQAADSVRRLIPEQALDG